MLKVKYSGVNDGKPYPVDMVAFKDGDSVSDLSVENGELKLNGEPVGGGSGGGEPFVVNIELTDDVYTIDKSSDEILTAFCNGKNIVAITPSGVGGFMRGHVRGGTFPSLIGHVEIGFVDSVSGRDPFYCLYTIKGVVVTYKELTMTVAE